MEQKHIIYLSYLVIIFIAINLLFKIFFFISAFFEEAPINGDLISGSLFPIDVMNKIIFIHTAIYIGLIVLFVIWVYGINSILHFYKNMSFSPLWSVLWFIIPIAFFYKPYYVIEDIWVKSTNNREGFVKLWWFFVLSSTFLGRFIFNIILRLFDTDQYHRILISYTFTDAMGIIMFMLSFRLLFLIVKGSIRIFNSKECYFDKHNRLNGMS